MALVNGRGPAFFQFVLASMVSASSWGKESVRPVSWVSLRLRFAKTKGGKGNQPWLCWPRNKRKKRLSLTFGFKREGGAVKSGRKWWKQPNPKNKGHRGAVCREEKFLWLAAAVGCEKKRV